MKTHLRMALGVFAGFGLGALTVAGAHAQAAPPVYEGDRMLGPTSADATGQDFTDAKGRRWIAVGKVVPREINVAETEAYNHSYRLAAPPPPQTLPVQYLAEKLRPRRLVGGYEYRLELPDLDLAEKILFGGTPRPTDSFRPSTVVAPQFIIGADTRIRLATPGVYPGSAFAHLSQTCTATMIGPSTALCAAHCFYNQNGWIQSQSITFGADTVPPGPGAPFGSSLADSVTLPGAWNGTDWDWDFAVLDFGTSSLGRSTGWFGTEANDGSSAPTDSQTIIGYPFDKPVPSSWLKVGSYTAASGARYEHNIAVVAGDSGACAYNVHGRCTGIQSTQWCCGADPSNPTRVWNEVRRWDSTTYNFFHAHSNWPAQ
jgi:V8-like Glu-specific endopeptidase